MGFFDETTWTNQTRRINSRPFIYNGFKPDYDEILEAQKKQQEEFMQKLQKVKSNGGVKKVIFNYPATIVYWNDGDKTVVKCSDNDIWSRWAGFAMAVCKKLVCDNDTVKFHRWMKANCGEEAKLTESVHEEKNAGTFIETLNHLLDDLWDPNYKVEDDD